MINFGEQFWLKRRQVLMQKKLECVYFKRAKDDRWRGPGIVSDSVRGQVSVKMGRYFYPCRHEDLLRVTNEELKRFKEKNKINDNESVLTRISEERKSSDDKVEESSRKSEENYINDQESVGTRVESEFLTVASRPSIPVTIPSEENLVPVENTSSSVIEESSDHVVSKDHTTAKRSKDPHSNNETPVNSPSPVVDAHSSSTNSLPDSNSSVHDSQRHLEVPENIVGDMPGTSPKPATEPDLRPDNSPTITVPAEHESESMLDTPEESQTSILNLKKGDKIQFRLDEQGDKWIDSEVIGRSRKGKGKGEWFTCEVDK